MGQIVNVYVAKLFTIVYSVNSVFESKTLLTS